MTGKIVPATADAVERAVGLLRDGQLVAFPTETVYGLGADATNPAAVRRIFTAKGRPPDHPVIVHLGSADQLGGWARDVPGAAWRLAEAFWPGPLTLIVPRSAQVLDLVTGGQDSVGLRVPSHPVARALLERFGGAVAAPSANRFGHVSPTTAQHVDQDLGDKVAMIIDGGASDVGIESTIVAFRESDVLLLRPGAIALDDVQRVVGYAPIVPIDGTAPRASGTLASHYAPRTPASLVPSDGLRAELLQLVDRDESIAVLARTVPRPDDFDGAWIDAPSGAIAYAHDLYAHLRALDAASADAILIENVPDEPAWLAIRDRLARATRGEHDDRD